MAGLPGPPPEWAVLGGRHPYPHGPFVPHHHPHFPHHMFAALDRPINTSPRIANGKKRTFLARISSVNKQFFSTEPSSTSLGPISINCSSAHSTTSPKHSPTQVGLLTTAGAPQSPQDDDISVTASPTPSPQAPPAFPGVPPPPNQLFNNALAASLFLNAPLLPTPNQWFYSQLYPHDWSWMHFRNQNLLPKVGSREESVQNPDSSSEKLDVMDVEEENESSAKNDDDTKDIKLTDIAKAEDGYFKTESKSNDGYSEAEKYEKSENNNSEVGKVENNNRKNEGINLSLKVRKAAITLVRQKDEVSSSNKDGFKISRTSSNRNSDVWRPY